MGGSLVFNYNYSKLFKGRIDELIYSLNATKKTNSSSGARQAIWGVALNLIKDKPILGYGTGDGKQVLLDAYKERGLNTLYEKKYNTHNQFLQTGLSLGVIGFLFLFLFWQ